MTDGEAFAVTRDMQATVDELRSKVTQLETDARQWSEIAKALYDYFVDGIGLSTCVQEYQKKVDDGRTRHSQFVQQSAV
jgi:hypothetical protein